jgi:2-polyprenyl-3-methyl-5-hydroxy-6-metoxy-1,4-benzoquinol methylase
MFCGLRGPGRSYPCGVRGETHVGTDGRPADLFINSSVIHGVDALSGSKFLDIGSGSGLFSGAAHRLHAHG